MQQRRARAIAQRERLQFPLVDRDLPGELVHVLSIHHSGTMASVATLAEAVDLARRLTADAGTSAEWERAMATWDAVTEAVETADLPSTTVAELLGFAAGARLERYWADEEAGDALEIAIDLYRRAVDVAAADDDNRPAYFANLGQALRTLWERDRIDAHLDQAIDALASCS